jgi:hypothetical protein
VRASVAVVAQTPDNLVQSPELHFDPHRLSNSPRLPQVVGGAIKVRLGPSVLGYQIVTHSITRSMSSIVNSELRLRLF